MKCSYAYTTTMYFKAHSIKYAHGLVVLHHWVAILLYTGNWSGGGGGGGGGRFEITYELVNWENAYFILLVLGETACRSSFLCVFLFNMIIHIVLLPTK